MIHHRFFIEKRTKVIPIDSVGNNCCSALLSIVTIEEIRKLKSVSSEARELCISFIIDFSLDKDFPFAKENENFTKLEFM